jgi:uncharacterized protein YegP (UPF0339 family)
MAYTRLLTGLLVTASAVVLTLASTPVEGQKGKDKDAGKATLVIELYNDKGGDVRFRIKEEDTILAIAPHGYEKKEDALKALELIKKGAATAKIDDQTKKGK